jgi:hypothetical protein
MTRRRCWTWRDCRVPGSRTGRGGLAYAVHGGFRRDPGRFAGRGLSPRLFGYRCVFWRGDLLIGYGRERPWVILSVPEGRHNHGVRWQAVLAALDIEARPPFPDGVSNPADQDVVCAKALHRPRLDSPWHGYPSCHFLGIQSAASGVCRRCGPTSAHSDPPLIAIRGIFTLFRILYRQLRITQIFKIKQNAGLPFRARDRSGARPLAGAIATAHVPEMAALRLKIGAPCPQQGGCRRRFPPHVPSRR